MAESEEEGDCSSYADVLLFSHLQRYGLRTADSYYRHSPERLCTRHTSSCQLLFRICTAHCPFRNFTETDCHIMNHISFDISIIFLYETIINILLTQNSLLYLRIYIIFKIPLNRHSLSIVHN